MAGNIPPTGEVNDDGPAPGITDEDRALFSEFLVSARRRAGRSLDEIAFSTKVPARYLEALEQGRVEVLPRGLYRRAIVRNYATAVGLDPALALERFGRIFGAEAVLLEWQGVPGVPVTSPTAGVLRQALALAPASGMKLTSFRFLAIPTQALPALKIREQLRPFALAGAISTAVVISVHFISDAIRTPPLSVAGTSATDVQTAARGTTPGAAPTHAVAPVVTSITGLSTNQLRTARGAADVPLTAGAISTPLRDADGLRAQPNTPPESLGVEARLVITSQPSGARVTVNGIGWGVTPITIQHLPPGAKVVRVTKDGYLGQERQVRLGEDGGTYSVGLTLRPRR